MKTKTKEEILIEQDWSKDITVPFETMYFETTKSILTAMPLYADQQSAIAVQNREEEIREWIDKSKFVTEKYGRIIFSDDLSQFLSTP